MNDVAPLLTRQKEEKKQDEPDPPGDFYVDEKNHQVLMSEAGHQKAEEILARIGLLPQGASCTSPRTSTSCITSNAACARITSTTATSTMWCRTAKW